MWRRFPCQMDWGSNANEGSEDKTKREKNPVNWSIIHIKLSIDINDSDTLKLEAKLLDKV